MHSTSRQNSISSQPRSLSYDSDQSSDTAGEDDLIKNAVFPMVPEKEILNHAMWRPSQQQQPNSVARLSQKFRNAQVIEKTVEIHPSTNTSTPSDDDDSHSRTSTLRDSEEEEKEENDDFDFEFPQKTPTAVPPKRADIHLSQTVYTGTNPSQKPEPGEENETPKLHHTAGPLESQLHSLMSKIIHLERANPTIAVTPEDYSALQVRVQALEAEKKTWNKRHEALFALRDEDVENNIKIRGLLAKERRQHDAMKKLRDDDLANVLAVRAKLAEVTRKLERLEREREMGNSNSNSLERRSTSPASSRPPRPASFLERRGTSTSSTADLFAVAKTAALEQRALEAERRNEDLVAQIQMLKKGAGIDDLNRVTAHQAWKEEVRGLQDEIATLKGSGASTGSDSGSRIGSGVAAGADSRISSKEYARIEALHEDHSRYREKMGQRIQALRCEKEGLMRELHRKEDECHELEAKVEKLQRRVSGI
ncbi:hypothetical protein GQ43DRAFT_439888 [Delitschia confertaspora ATCC 74209]|uniref:Uncharacterized protein n=1 Tax=Delitschia confertaspora ATCC 74209 TaxID=1513339 RepID=A0A9P4JNB7_9PLEO|nr:hypothetical protein GQ43DRAFT_439888 [Delitschia confertaspora ATCC 74209]